MSTSSSSGPPANPPERSALSYRLGTRSDFLREMLERLPWQTLPDGPYASTRPLANLATHSPRDPTVALLDAFAVVADVLTFYQERIVNEGFLRTATETRSVLELARAVGYELGPGLAASAWLAFTVEEAAGAPAQVLVKPGVRMLSVPGQDERPQTFETVEQLVARPEWNQLRPITSVPQRFSLDAQELWLRLPQGNLVPGDLLLLVSHTRETDEKSDRWRLRTVASVEQDTAAGRVRVHLVPQQGAPGEPEPAHGRGTIYLMNQRMAAFGHNAPDWLTMPAAVQAQYNAKYDSDNNRADKTNWPAFDLTLESSRLYLDNLYPRLLPKTWLVLVAGSTLELYWVQSVEARSHTNYALTARCSSPELDSTPSGSGTAGHQRVRGSAPHGRRPGPGRRSANRRAPPRQRDLGNPHPRPLPRPPPHQGLDGARRGGQGHRGRRGARPGGGTDPRRHRETAPGAGTGRQRHHPHRPQRRDQALRQRRHRLRLHLAGQGSTTRRAAAGDALPVAPRGCGRVRGHRDAAGQGAHARAGPGEGSSHRRGGDARDRLAHPGPDNAPLHGAAEALVRPGHRRDPRQRRRRHPRRDRAARCSAAATAARPTSASPSGASR